LPYTISVNSMPTILDYYGQVEHRTVNMQVLRLSASEKNAIFNALETNLLPENREYSYKFFMTIVRRVFGIEWRKFPGNPLLGIRMKV